jgi:hypothetical protein
MVPEDKQPPSALYLSEQLAKLSRRRRLKFEALSFHGAPNIDKNEARWKTNSFKAGSKGAIFPKHARINHGCVSSKNVAYNYNEEIEKLGTSLRQHFVLALIYFAQRPTL